MGIFSEFRQFAARGNVIDLAVGIIIGSAFNNIVSSLVNDIIMPPVGLLFGKVDFASLFINLSGQQYPSLSAAKAAGAPVIAYGQFINTLINFLIIAFVVFLLVRQINRLQKEGEKQKEQKPKEEVELLKEIRDLLKKKTK